MVNIGAGGIILRKNNNVIEVLLIERINAKTYNNMWSNPGGTKEDHESLETTCIRENEEEIGIKSTIIKKIGTYQEFRENELYTESTGFLVEIICGTPTIMEPDKIKNLRYFPVNNLPKKIAPYTLQYIRDLKL